MLIRPLERKDEEAVRDLIASILDEEFALEKMAYPVTDLEAISEHYRGPRDSFFVAVEDGRIVGTVAVKEDDSKTALLRRIFVDASYRGKRFGSQLVERALAFSREKGYKRIVFRGTASMTQALALMQRKGFSEKERIRFGEVEMILLNRSL